MPRGLWIFAALFAALAIAMIYQTEMGGGVDRPWTECKENLFTQMISGDCTPRNGFAGPSVEPGTQTSPEPDSGSGDALNSPLVQQR